MIKKNSQGKHREGLWKDKEWLENQYINLNKTCDNIAEICDCGSTTIRYWLIYFDIPIRSISEGKKGRKILNYKTHKVSEETKKKISEANKGNTSWNKGLTKDTNEILMKLSKLNMGRRHTEETKRKISDANKGVPSWKKGKEFPQLQGSNHCRWKGKRTKQNNGYIYIYQPDHPFVNKKRYVYEHRLVMEQKIRRYLLSTEIIHHINEIKDDNRIENHYLCKDTAIHSKLHQQIQRVALQLFRSKKCGKIKFSKDIGEYYIVFGKGAES